MAVIRGTCGAIVLIGLIWWISPAGQTPQPPVAPIIPHQETRFGATAVDNYYWLREKSNPEVIKYLERENAYTEAMTKGEKPF